MENKFDNVRGHIFGLIAELADAEKITKAKLGQLSRELMVYVIESKDISAANRLLDVLTPVNKRATIAFLSHFLPWSPELDEDKNFVRFGKMMKGQKAVDKRKQAVVDFLADKDNTIWTWQKDNITVEAKPTDFFKSVEKSVERALKGNDNTPPLAREDVIKALFAAGITIDDLLEAVTQPEGQSADSRNVDIDIPVIKAA